MADPITEIIKPNQNPPANGGDANQKLLAQWLAQQPRGDNNRTIADDNVDPRLNRQALIMMRPGVCASCHPHKEEFSKPLTLDYGFYGKGFDKGFDKGFGNLSRAGADKPKTLSPQEREEAEKRQFNNAPVEEKIAQSLLRLPDKLSIKIDDKSLSIKTDFLGLAKMVPGTEIDPGTGKILGSLKELSIQHEKDASKVSLEFNSAQTWKLDKVSLPMLGKISELKLTDKEGKLNFNLKTETLKDGATVVKIEHIQGLKLATENLGDMQINALRLTNRAGKLGLEFAAGPVPKDGAEPFYLPFPLASVAGDKDLSSIAPMLSKVADFEKLIKSRDLSPLIENLPADASGFSETITKFLSSIESVEKNGRDITILRKNGTVKQDLGGAELSISPVVGLRLGSRANAPSLDKISGVNVAVDVPSQLGFPNNKMNVPIESLTMSTRDSAGRRTVSVGTAGSQVADYVSVRLDGNMKPVRDSNGDFYVNTRVANLLSENSRDKLYLSLRFNSSNQLDMKTSEVLGIVSRASAQGADLSLAGAGKALIADVTAVGAGISWLFGY